MSNDLKALASAIDELANCLDRPPDRLSSRHIHHSLAVILLCLRDIQSLAQAVVREVLST